MNDTVFSEFFISDWTYNFKCCTFLALAVYFISIFFSCCFIFSFVVSNLFTLLCDVKFPELCAVFTFYTNNRTPIKSTQNEVTSNTVQHDRKPYARNTTAQGLSYWNPTKFQRKMRNKKKNRVREGE